MHGRVQSETLAAIPGIRNQRHPAARTMSEINRSRSNFASQ
jgi:hypothetical protein